MRLVSYTHIFTSSEEYFCIGTDQRRRQLNRRLEASSVAHLSTGTRVHFLVIVVQACLYLNSWLYRHLLERHPRMCNSWQNVRCRA